MDLNELLHAHQVAVMQASGSGDDRARDNHFAKVADYAERVRHLREMNQMTDSPTPANQPETIIYGSYAGEAATAPPRPVTAEPIQSWEEEGGAVVSPEPLLPDGVTSRLVREYRVGPYVYQDLDLAVAEHLRRASASRDPTA